MLPISLDFEFWMLVAKERCQIGQIHANSPQQHNDGDTFKKNWMCLTDQWLRGKEGGRKNDTDWWCLCRNLFHSEDLREYCALTDAKDRITLLYRNCCHVLINHFRFAFTDIWHEVWHFIKMRYLTSDAGTVHRESLSRNHFNALDLCLKTA